MRVTALTPYPDPAPSTRFRVAQFREPLAKEGIDLEILSFFTGQEYAALYHPGEKSRKIRILAGAIHRRMEQIEVAAAADLILVHRELSPVFSVAFIRRLGPRFPPVVFDFDDAIFLPPRGGNPLLNWFRRPEGSTGGLCRRASLVLAGNEYLANFATEARGGVTGVEVLPTVIDTDLYAPTPKKEEPTDGISSGYLPVAGWIGTHSTLPYLEAIYGSLAQVASQTPFRLLVVCNRAPRSEPGLEVEFREWSREREVLDLADMDVGIYPLPDDSWTRGKCGFKAIQYMACGIPLVASPVGVLGTIVLDGETGVLASDSREWSQGLTRLLRNPELRRAMGMAGRSRAQAAYSVTAALPRLISGFGRLLR